MNNGVVRDRDNNFSRHQTFKDGVTIEGGLTVDITGGSNEEETADFTAEAGKVYVVDTSSTAITATLPASPAALEEVTFMDGAKTFNSNALTVNMNGKKLDGATVSTKVHTTKGGAFKYIYRNATYGWLLKAFILMLFALSVHAGDFTYETNSWEQDSGLSIGTDKLKPRTAGSLLSISDSAGTTVATITTSAMTITTATITGLTATIGSISTLDVSTSQIGTLSLTNALTVSNGGTGLSTLVAGRIPYGAGTAALASSANFVFSSNRLDLTNPSGAQARLTHSSGKYTDFKTDGDGNLTIAPSGGVKKTIANFFTKRSTSATSHKIFKAGSSVSTIQRLIAVTVPATGGLGIIRIKWMVTRESISTGYYEYYFGRIANQEISLGKFSGLGAYGQVSSGTFNGGTTECPAGLSDTSVIQRTGAEADTEPQQFEITINGRGSATGHTGSYAAEIEIFTFNTNFDILTIE